MTDTRTKAQRSRIMQSVRTSDTGPELIVRKILHRLGYRFRVNRVDLPGRPDIVLPSYRTTIFVHGCFWHGHGCRKGRLPKSRLEYWGQKIARNVVRDTKVVSELECLGWQVIVIWQCQLNDLHKVTEQLHKVLHR